MALREKFGRLVLLDETDTDPLGSEYRAARLGPAGLDRLVSVLRFSDAVSAHAEATKRLVDAARSVSQLQSPSLVRVLGVGRVGHSFYVSTELADGRTLRAILGCCAEEGFPFAVDHALMIASRAAAGLEYLHGRKDESGRSTVHGLLTPGRIVVSFDGEVKLKGLGLWPALGPAGLLAPEERAYLAPEQASGEAERRTDVYALGLVLLEALSAQATDDSDPLERIAAARIAVPGGDPGPLPKPLLSLLRRALGRDPATRFGGMAEMRRAIDALLFSGDFTPTTFDLAFFMHTLFRDQVERDTRAIEEATAADYREFLTEEAAKPASSAAPNAEPADARSSVPNAKDASLPTPAPASTAPELPRAHDTSVAHGTKTAPVAGAGPESSAARHARQTREPPARDAGRSTFGASLARASPRRSLWLVVGLVAALALGGGAGWLYLVAEQRAAAAAAAERAAAQAHVHELEARIALLEKEKAEAEARAAEDARHTLEQQAAAGGQTADPAAIARAQDEARQRARAEQERKQQEERARLAEAKRSEERLAAPAQPAVATPAPLPTPSPVPAAATSAAELSPAAPPAGTVSPAPGGTLVPSGGASSTGSAAPASTARSPADPADPAVRPPGLISEEVVPYPPRALPRRLAAVVVVRALVDESGRVAEATIVQASGQPFDYGFEQAALRRVRSRKYRPASRNDVPVPIWVVVRMEFKPPR